MIKLKFEATSTEIDPFTIVAEGQDFNDAVIDLLREFTSSFGGEPNEELFKGLASLAQGEEEYESIDFGTPEDNFILTIEKDP